jgi:RHS repeat-associated protein
VAIYTQQNDGTEKTRYIHTDHLGSTDVITDENGQIKGRMSFAAFGNRRHADWDNPTSVLAGIETHHGFTGHEHLDEVGIIHMNGRLYDPQLGRFLSPDVQVQYPDQTQSFNRYTYVNNNPLSYTDPSGYGFFSKLWKKIRRIAAVVVAVVAAVWTLGFTALLTGNVYIAAAAAGFVGGFTYGVTATGNLQSAFQYGLVGANVGLAIVSAFKLGSGLVKGAKNFFDLAARPVGSFGGPDVAVAQLAQNAGHHYTNYVVRRQIGRIAEKNGISTATLNISLISLSFAGNQIVGNRIKPDGTESGLPEIHGVLSRMPDSGGLINSADYPALNNIVGLPFDVVDVVLGYQGLPTATWVDAYNEGYFGKSIAGHSLGSLDASNLSGIGLVKSARLFSLPFGNISPSSASLTIGSLDIMNGGFAGKLLNPFATVSTGRNGMVGHRWCYYLDYQCN